ncbi:mRNA splicing protein [Coemansia sp. RSA 988]|nr:mRNA splicing protein [Coemansia sp. RSA 988]
MSSISQFLPEPKSSYTKLEAQEASPAATEASKALVSQDAAKRDIPPYGKRSGWVPKTAEDFGDGGAYPEVHMLQYPLGMGRRRGKKGNALAKQVDGEGNASYGALARYGRRENETVHSQFKELIPLRQRKDFDDNQDAIPERPDAEAVREAAERTKLALEKKLGGRMNARPGKGIKGSTEEPTYVRYTPNQQGPGYNSGAAQRIVRVSDMPVDPMEPPKIRLQKEAQRPASPPAPVMHSPSRKVTAEEQREWTIPPCVSNWKNIHGFTVSLDKRLATDGRGMEEISVNDNFARLSEALISAESQARKEISERSQVQQTLARKEKEEKEERLRMLAQRAREERAAAAIMPQSVPEAGRGYEPPPMDVLQPPPSIREANTMDKSPQASRRSSPEPRRTRPGHMAATDFFNSEAANNHSSRRRSRSPEGVREREEQRREKRKQHERELRLSRMGSDAKAKYLRKAESRDISEKIALGIAKPTGTRESMFDTRLFNQTSASNAALQNDEAYNLYDKPLFNNTGRSSANYRPRAVEEEQGRAGEVERMMDSDRFGAQLHGLGSSERSDANGAKHRQQQTSRSGPVEFEKGDVFGIDAFADTARQSKNGRH